MRTPALVLAILSACQSANDRAPTRLQFVVSFPAELSAEPLDGRMLLMISKGDDREPRLQIGDSAESYYFIF